MRTEDKREEHQILLTDSKVRFNVEITSPVQVREATLGFDRKVRGGEGTCATSGSPRVPDRVCGAVLP